MAEPLKRNLFFALIAGALGGALTAVLRPSIPDSARPVVKSAARAGIRLYEQAREIIGEWAETASDIFAEAKAELEEEHQKAAASERMESEQVVPFEARPGTEAGRKSHA
jgi:hypothetical protein